MYFQGKNIQNFGILRDFNGNGFKLVNLAYYRPKGIEDDRKFTSKGDAGNDSKLDNSLCRTRSRIFELALCNPWELFVTLTLDQQKYDRHDLPKFVKDLGQTIRDYRKKAGHDVKYLLIPERHKDGCWHMHGFFMGLPKEELHAFQRTEHLPTHILERLDQGIQVYTWDVYAKRFGFASIEEIVNQEAASKYILKYITKEAMNTITELNAHAFYASKGLNRSTVIHQDILSLPVENPDFQGEHCIIKWFDDLALAMAPFGGEVSS